MIAGEKFPRPWDVLGLSHPGEQRDLEKSLCGDRWNFCSSSVQPAASWYCNYFFWSQNFLVTVAISGDFCTAFYFRCGEEQRGSVCLLHWPHPRCSSAVLVHIDSREGTDKQFYSIAHTWVPAAVWDAWVVQNTLVGWQTRCRACSKPIFFLTGCWNSSVASCGLSNSVCPPWMSNWITCLFPEERLFVRLKTLRIQSESISPGSKWEYNINFKNNNSWLFEIKQQNNAVSV